jgi:hypothetical protein
MDAAYLARWSAGQVHPQVPVRHGGQSAMVDVDIAALVAGIWRCGIRTFTSCQDDPSGRVFLSLRAGDAGRLVRLLARPGQDDPLTAAILGELGVPPERWWRFGAGATAEGPAAWLGVSVYVPPEDLAALERRVRAARRR